MQFWSCLSLDFFFRIKSAASPTERSTLDFHHTMQLAEKTNFFKHLYLFFKYPAYTTFILFFSVVCRHSYGHRVGIKPLKISFAVKTQKERNVLFLACTLCIHLFTDKLLGWSVYYLWFNRLSKHLYRLYKCQVSCWWLGSSSSRVVSDWCTDLLHGRSKPNRPSVWFHSWELTCVLLCCDWLVHPDLSSRALIQRPPGGRGPREEHGLQSSRGRSNAMPRSLVLARWVEWSVQTATCLPSWVLIPKCRLLFGAFQKRHECYKQIWIWGFSELPKLW